MNKFKDFLPQTPIFVGTRDGYKLYVCGVNPPKMVPAKKDIYLSCDVRLDPVFGFVSEKFFFGPVIPAAQLELSISKSEYEYYYGESFKKLGNLILDKMNLDAVHFFSKDVLKSSYPFKFEREESEGDGAIEMSAEYDILYAHIGDNFSLLHQKTDEVHDLMLYFIASQVLSVGKKFDFDTANQLALYLCGSTKVTEEQLQKTLMRYSH